MNDWQLTLAIGAALTTIISWRLHRARYLVALGVASFVASTAWARYGLPLPPVAAAFMDGAVCLWIYHTGREHWELAVWRVFQAMVLINLLYLGGVIIPHSVYVSVLELLNWAALAIMSGTAFLERIGHEGRLWFGRTRGFYWLASALRQERSSNPWHQNRR